MIYHVPNNWEYQDSLEMLLLFYQCADELRSEVTPDSYSLPQHNALTLLDEIENVYYLLESYGITSEYYEKYIPPIIDEFLSQLEDDYIFKRFLGARLFTIRTGFQEASKSPIHLVAWLDAVRQICALTKYRKAYEQEIIRLIENTKDKQKLLYCTSNYFVTLRWAGYSREHLYTATKKYFSNKSRIIKNSFQIRNFLELFPCKKERFDFLILLDIDSIEYMDSISENLTLSKQIEKVDLKQERKNLLNDYVAAEILKEYDSRIYQAGSHEKMAIVRFYDEDFDPLSAATRFVDYISFLQAFARYFKHFYYSKQVYRILVKKEDGYYREIKLPNKLQKRPFISQEVIDSRIRNILEAESMGYSAFISLTRAIEMHAEAFDSRSMSTLLRTFWTALETLFSNPNPSRTRENVINSVLPIIQKTYILKKLRALHLQISEAIDEKHLSCLGIADFQSFVEYFSTYTEDSAEMKKVYAYLPDNPLLRSRIFMMRKSLSDGKNIYNYLERHRQRIEWQLKRLYRIRNIATHLGQEMDNTAVAVNHLHNYFDFSVNYLLCKSENGDYVANMSSLVFEAKNDLRIYYEYLKKNEKLVKNNYKELLFGPDQQLINYQFEH